MLHTCAGQWPVSVPWQGVGGRSRSCRTPHTSTLWGLPVSHIEMRVMTMGVLKCKKVDSPFTVGGNVDGVVAAENMVASLSWPAMQPPMTQHLLVDTQTHRAGHWKDICHPRTQFRCSQAQEWKHFQGPWKDAGRKKRKSPYSGISSSLEKEGSDATGCTGLTLEDITLRNLRQRSQSPLESATHLPLSRLRLESPVLCDQSSGEVAQRRSS